MVTQLKKGYDVGMQVADDPLVQVIDDFVTEKEREHIIGLARRNISRAKVTGTDENKFSEGRTGSVAWLKHDQTPIIRKLVRRVSEIVGIPTTHAESLQVVHYGEDQQYKPHYDAWRMDTEKGRLRTANGGQRVVTALMYLNEVEAGGGTEFPKLNLEVDPLPGRMVLFHDTEDDGYNLHLSSLHGGSPVLLGEKWACNLWFRAEPYDRPGDASPRAQGAARRPKPGAKKKRKSQKGARRKNR